MRVPSKIENHSADALARLMSYLQGKPNMEALLTCLSAARIDIKRIGDAGTLYGVTLNDCRIEYSSVEEDTPATVADALMELINDGAGIKDIESFEDGVIGEFFQGPQVHGTWTIDPFGQPLGSYSGFTFSGSEVLVGNQSISSNHASGIPPKVGGGPLMYRNALVSAFPGWDDEDQTWIYWMRWPSSLEGFPQLAPGDTLQLLIGMMGGEGMAYVYFWLSVTNTNWSLVAFMPGGTVTVPFGPYPLSALLDDQWHKLTVKFDRTGFSYLTFEVDDGAYGGTVTPNPLSADLPFMPSNIFGIMAIHDLDHPSGIADLPDFYIDKLSIGPGAPCGEETVVGGSRLVEGLEAFTPPTVMIGSGDVASWIRPFTPTNYIGDYPVVDDDAHTGSNSARTDFGSGITLYDDGSPFSPYHLALTSVWGGSDDPIQKGFAWFKIPAGFPSAAWEATGLWIAPLNFAYIDPATNAQIWIQLVCNPPYNTISMGAAWLTMGGWGMVASPVEVPLSYLTDGSWHKISWSFDKVATFVRVDIDNDTYLFEDTPAADGGNVSWFGVASNTEQSSSGSTITTVPDVRFDDVGFGRIGGEVVRAVCWEAEKINESDQFLYVRTSCTPGEELRVLSDTPDEVGFRRIGIVDQLQELEDAFYDLLVMRWLSTAEGEQLDAIGQVVGLLRSGMPDEEFRASLSVQIRKNLSQGEPETLIEVLRVTTASTVVELREPTPARVVMDFNGEPIHTIWKLLTVMDGLAAGGVRLELNRVPDFPFGFDDDGDPSYGGFDEGEFAAYYNL